MPAKTIAEAAEELRLLIQELKVYFDGHYQQKSTSRRYLVSVVVSMVASLCFSIGFTTFTISTCFLQGDESPPFYCTSMPGYNDSTKQNREIIKEFRELQKRSLRNERRIDRLEDGR